ncbi:MAG: hypothetical protein R6V17_07415 [Halanaerobacter sp.]
MSHVRFEFTCSYCGKEFVANEPKPVCPSCGYDYATEESPDEGGD